MFKTCVLTFEGLSACLVRRLGEFIETFVVSNLRLHCKLIHVSFLLQCGFNFGHSRVGVTTACHFHFYSELPGMWGAFIHKPACLLM